MFNLLKIAFASLAFGILVLSLLINFFEQHVPTSIVQAFRYGKHASERKTSLITLLEVPKRWFKHFYIVATIYSSLTLALVVGVYMFGAPVPRLVSKFMQFVGSSKNSTNATAVFLATILFCIQTWKRLYETLRISVFSDTKINVAQYLVGIFHYIGAATAILVEAPLFSLYSLTPGKIQLTDVTWRALIGTCTFTWACYHQYKSAVILANLRKDKDGRVVSLEHKLPKGDLFNGVSSPHMFCEVLMYLSLYMILWGNTTWPYVFFWVFCNQCETALLSHWWYQSNFQGYPKNRRAFIPFIL